ncbi:hypothetical protein [Xylanimonas ulmi]|uniref:Uncharacterized protein n=1 Tax=Xylanimonas ulmi TaxID=228973 RepID=A0A4Q7M4K6_9MICO|nr:hypothetical protein [Xylanibacterium ulmi]RZS62524.1 hypothetical protein EV386_2860 [Xylanibacterium ulmi]
MSDSTQTYDDTLRLWVFPDQESATAAAVSLRSRARLGESGVGSAYLIGWDGERSRYTAQPVAHVVAPAMGRKRFRWDLIWLTLTAPFLGLAGGLAYVGFTSQALSSLGRDRVRAALAEVAPGEHAIIATVEDLDDPEDVTLAGAVKALTIG